MRIFFICAFLILTSYSVGNAQEIYNIMPGEEVLISISTDTNKVVGFGFELGSKSRKATRKCPIRKSETAVDLRLCGGIFDANNLSESGAFLESDLGGSMLFQPVNGEIKVILRNYARIQMTYVVTIEDVD